MRPVVGPPSESRDHRALLQRQLAARWGWRNDKDDQVHAPLLEWRGWKRVRFWGIPHLTGFRYGKDHSSLTVAVPVELEPGGEVTSKRCMERFEAEARPRIKHYDVALGPMRTRTGAWKGEPLVVKWVDGKVSTGFRERRFSAAWAAYPAYDGACLVYAVAVPWDEEERLARAVRDRWVSEGFERMQTLTQSVPYRH